MSAKDIRLRFSTATLRSRDWCRMNGKRFFARTAPNARLQVQRLGNAIEKQGSQLRKEMAEMETRITGRLLRWMFVFWTGTTITMLGAMFAITRL